MTGRVVHVSDNVPGAIYIGRAVPRRGIAMSRFANPYRIGPNWGLLGGRVLSREEAIEQFRTELTGGALRHLYARLPELRGKPLACWCRHDGEAKTGENACHGDVLLDLLDRYTDDELRALAVK